MKKKAIFIVVAVMVLLGCFMFSNKEMIFKAEPQVQVFDGRQQVPTDKPTGTVVAKGRLY